MASFTGIGNELILGPIPYAESTVDIAISGTYNMTIVFQVEKGGPGSGAWETVNTYDTANATVAETYVTKAKNERVRLYVQVDTSGTATVTLTESTNTTVKTFQDIEGTDVLDLKEDLVTFGQSVTGPAALNIGSATTLTAKDHGGRIIALDSASGATLTLPDATGSGVRFKFVVITDVTSNDYIVQAPDADNVFVGSVLVQQDSADTLVGFDCASTTDTITLNGTTKGGNGNDWLEFVDLAADTWFVTGVLSATGTEVTPFSAAVS